MSKDWSDQTRYADTKRYLETVDAGLANHVHQTLPGSTQAAGAALSLRGNKLYALTGNAIVGRAVRALMLCQRAYLGPNWAKQTGALGAGIPADLRHATGAQLTMDTYLGKSEAAVRLAIQAYIALNPAASAVADAAELVGNGTSPIGPPFEKLTRAQNPFPSGQVCFNCVYWWLFKSGCVSLRWILHKGLTMGAENANNLLGIGVPQARDVHGNVPPIARGMVINWRGNQPDTDGICHWAVALGNGYAIGANNTLAGLVNGLIVNVNFRVGGATRTLTHADSVFGVFSIDDMWRVYGGDKTRSPTSGLPGCIMAVINPITIPVRNRGE